MSTRFCLENLTPLVFPVHPRRLTVLMRPSPRLPKLPFILKARFVSRKAEYVQLRYLIHAG